MDQKPRAGSPKASDMTVHFVHPYGRQVFELRVHPNMTVGECLDQLHDLMSIEPEQDGGRYHVLDIRNGREISRFQELRHTGLASGDRLFLAHWARRC